MYIDVRTFPEGNDGILPLFEGIEALEQKVPLRGPPVLFPGMAGLMAEGTYVQSARRWDGHRGREVVKGSLLHKWSRFSGCYLPVFPPLSCRIKARWRCLFMHILAANLCLVSCLGMRIR